MNKVTLARLAAYGALLHAVATAREPVEDRGCRRRASDAVRRRIVTLSFPFQSLGTRTTGCPGLNASWSDHCTRMVRADGSSY